MGDAPVLIPDAGPWITLAYADGLDLLLKPGWPVAMVDMVLEELTRSQTPTSQQIGAWVKDQCIPVWSTEVCRRAAGRRQRNVGEMAIQETMQALAMEDPPRRGVFLFEDHKIAPAPFLLFQERGGWLDSAVAIERRAIEAGRQFSRLRFPLGFPPD
ncbi:MAG: hypothetical protein ACI9IO_001825 [Cyanobium sp.]|jgi:hypothetical protein